MKIELNGQSFDVPSDFVAQLAESFYQLLEAIYQEKIDDKTKIGLMAITRTMLVKEELAVRMTQGKEAAKALRPPPKTDPNLWLARMFLPYVKEVVQHAEITCETSGDTVTAFNFSIPRAGSTGGQVDTARIERLRQNNELEIS